MIAGDYIWKTYNISEGDYQWLKEQEKNAQTVDMKLWVTIAVRAVQN